jgi:UDP-N-acetylglucosamine transferase subunit ALG13
VNVVQKIAYYISDYGFGHATRSIAIIRELLKSSSDLHFTVCTSFSLSFIERSLKNEDQTRLHYRDVQNDFGFILKENSIEPDPEEMNLKYEQYVSDSENYVNREAEFLTEMRINLIIGDIPPFCFTAARQAGLPSIGISNFTWYTAYKDFISHEKLDVLKRSYQKMYCFFALGGSREPQWGQRENLFFDYFSRHDDPQEVVRIQSLVNPTGEKTVVYFGLGMKVEAGDLTRFKIWDSPDCVFIVSHNMPIFRENVHHIPKNYTESQNYIAASDIVISKPGWGTVAEAITFNKRLLLLNRPNMKEDRNTIQYLKSEKRCELISWEQLMTTEIDEVLLKTLNKQVKNSKQKLKGLS